jgi:hypothetical protein
MRKYKTNFYSAMKKRKKKLFLVSLVSFWD